MDKSKYDRTFENAMRERGASVRCCWQISGPKNTAVSGMEMLMIHGEAGAFTMALVQTFADGGWEVYTPPTHRNSIESTLDAVEAVMAANRPAAERAPGHKSAIAKAKGGAI